MLCLQFFLAEQVVRRGWTIPYSFARNYVSDLGAIGCSALVCSPWHAVMNCSFVLQGLLIAGGAVLNCRRWSLALLVICGLGVVVVGFVPEDADSGLHRLGAALHFLGGGLGIAAAGLNWRRSGFRWISVATGLAVLGATVCLAAGGGGWTDELGAGTVERVAAYGIAGWMFAAGAGIMASETGHKDTFFGARA
jgi:hypothetical membrane protein